MDAAQEQAELPLLLLVATRRAEGEAGLAVLPAAALMVMCAPLSARLIVARGARVTLLTGYGFVLLGFLVMLLVWRDGVGYWAIALGYGLAWVALQALGGDLGAGYFSGLQPQLEFKPAHETGLSQQ